MQFVRYQVFVSSTFTDLKEERAEVIQAIWELDCIPTGMEAFVAKNESQWEVIQKVIDECDYYVLIVGGRYGSITPEGISYTEKEYNYAKKLQIPVLCFIHGEPENIISSKTESDDSSRKQLYNFKDRILTEYPVKKWTHPQELGGHVSRSLSRAIKVNPRPGWIRNEGSSNLELLEQINNLTKENSNLKDKLNSSNNSYENIDELSGGSDTLIIHGHARIIGSAGHKRNMENKNWSSTLTWDTIFREIGHKLLTETTENEIRLTISRFIGWSKEMIEIKNDIYNYDITDETFGSVIVQFRALGLIEKGTRKRAVSDRANYWRLTERGERHLVGLLAQKKPSPAAKPQHENLFS
ncbi:DUF4062 domain-containing protein [Ancylobacter sp. G4_0304]|uniref:DUF4062 domain-containing protein n=1 Tax=Ancylobacter sp. G4_0304 TaxID=3114289 RepID=UPI0039C61C8B